MKVTSTKEHRQKMMKEIGPNYFESAEDYFYFVHMNHWLRWAHAVGFVFASFIFLVSIIELSWILFIVQYLVSTLPAVASHYFLDGYVNRNVVQKPLHGLRLGIRLNLNFLMGKTKEQDKVFIQKYPFVKSVFEAQGYG